jgi:hypothetical protein
MLTIPNALTFLRFLGIPFFLHLALNLEADGWAIAVLAVGGATDYFDGKLARAWGQTSRFGEIADPDLVSEPGLLRWRMDGGGDAKISLLATDFTGRAAHLHQRNPDSWDLVVRDVVVDPAGQYVDALWTPPYKNGWAFQACRVRSLDGGFNELEYHAPAGRRTDVSRVWAFRN